MCGHAFGPIPQQLGAIDRYFAQKRGPESPGNTSVAPRPTKPKQEPVNGLAITSLSFGCLAMFFWEYSLFSLVAVICGLVALQQIKQTDARGTTPAWIGIVTGGLFLLVRLTA